MNVLSPIGRVTALATFLVAASFALVPATPPADAAAIAPSLAARLATADPNSTVEAIVVLRQQAALSSDAGVTHDTRVTRVVQELRRVASAAQGPVLTLLAQRRSQQMVSEITPLWILNGVIVSARPAVLRELARRSDVLEIRPSTVVSAPAPAFEYAASEAPPEQNLAVVNAPQLWSLGYRGQGVVVANLDTGVDATHPDLAGSWRGGKNSWYDPNGEHPAVPTDVNGHGTWTMGAIAGGSSGGTAIGMAPGAKWIAAKIFSDRGTATTARIHQAFQWLLDPDGSPATADAPNVVNDSWVMSAPGCNLEFQLDLQRLRAAGILPVFAAGNGGPAPSTGYSPADNPEAFPVGSTNNLDVLADSSSRGPGCGGSLYPNLTAPGQDIATTDLYGYYASESGTSMAAPHVAGALALLLSGFPNLSADRQAAALQSGALDLGAPGLDNSFGYGRLDALSAFYWIAATPDFTLRVAPSPASTLPGGAASYTVTVGSVGGFSSDVALSVSGLSGSQASWTFSPSTVTGAAGTSTLTLTTASSLAPGTYGLTLTASAGGVTHAVPVSLLVMPPPDFTVSGSPSSASVVPGGTVTYRVTIGSLGGFSGPVGLSLSGLPPSQGSWTFSPATVMGSGTSTLALTTAGSLAPGTYPLTITGTSGTISRAAPVSLVVAGDFTVAVSPPSLSLSRGRSASYTISLGAIGGFSGTVTLSISGLPSGATTSFSSNPVRAPGSSTLTVRTTASTARGTFPLKITAKSGVLVHLATATLTVT